MRRPYMNKVIVASLKHTLPLIREQRASTTEPESRSHLDRAIRFLEDMIAWRESGSGDAN